MLCDICTSIFHGSRDLTLRTIGPENSRTLRYTHHATTQSLIDSAYLNCYICSAVWNDASSRGFTRGPQIRWQNNCSTSYVIQVLDRQTLSQASLELLISYARKRRVIDDGPGINEVVYYTKFILEPALTGPKSTEMDQTVIGSTGSDAAFSLASAWISNCIVNHPECIQLGHSDQQLPTRLIKVSNADSDIVHLCEASNFRNEADKIYPSGSERYFTLSHCWGFAQIMTLRRSTYERLKSGISISTLPRTFQDAIRFTRESGVEYIWIDSLCIYQDSIDDWLKESAAMTGIYRQALCNIAATASSNSNGGCFRERNIRSIEPCTITARWKELQKGTYSIYNERLWDLNVASAPLCKRAWVVQERLLAPRILHFGQNQLFWECRSMNACETFPDGMPPCLSLSDPTLNFKGLNPSIDGENLRKFGNWDCSDSIANQLYVWEKIVRTFTACGLTKVEDKLVAISGIAKQVQPLIGNPFPLEHGTLSSYKRASYLAGLWDFYLPSQLLWEIKQGKRPNIYRAPSWSWASLDGEVSFQTAFNDGTDLVEVLLSRTLPASEDPFGQVSDGSIQLCGTLVEVSVAAASKSSLNESFILSTKGGSIGALCRPDVPSDGLEGRLYCMPIRKYRVTIGNVRIQRLGCLILKLDGTHTSKFRRCAQLNLENEIDQRLIERYSKIKIPDLEACKAEFGKYIITII